MYPGAIGGPRSGGSGALLVGINSRTRWGNTMIGAILAAVLLTVVAVAAAAYIAALALTYAVIRSESRVGMAKPDLVHTS